MLTVQKGADGIFFNIIQLNQDCTETATVFFLLLFGNLQLGGRNIAGLAQELTDLIFSGPGLVFHCSAKTRFLGCHFSLR